MPRSDDLALMTLLEQAKLLRNGKCSSRDIVDACLTRIDRYDARLHAFVEVFGDDARKLADAADKARSSGHRQSILAGLPVGFKDLLQIEGHFATSGSCMWRERRARTNATVVEKLVDAGMIPIGRLHMVELAFGGWGANPMMGTPWNPWDATQQRVPGGSSSGCAVAVAARLVPAAIGSDTGGSVRVPAAFTGITALKTTYGRISLFGAGPLSWTLDSIGPMANSVEDCGVLLAAMSGPDARDPATQGLEPFELIEEWPENLQGVRIALPDRDQLPSFVHQAVVDAWRHSAEILASAGAEVVPTVLPEWFFDLSRPASTIIAMEACHLYGTEVGKATNPIGDVVRERVLRGRSIGAQEYASALDRMREFRRGYLEEFDRYDALLLPTVAIPAPLLSTIDESSPLPNYLTRPVNYLGLCALALPAALHEGLPLGIQLVGKPFAERTILQIGRVYEFASRFDRRTLPEAALA